MEKFLSEQPEIQPVMEQLLLPLQREVICLFFFNFEALFTCKQVQPGVSGLFKHS